jgi:hypothetical protein
LNFENSDIYTHFNPTIGRSPSPAIFHLPIFFPPSTTTHDPPPSFSIFSQRVFSIFGQSRLPVPALFHLQRAFFGFFSYCDPAPPTSTKPVFTSSSLRYCITFLGYFVYMYMFMDRFFRRLPYRSTSTLIMFLP